MTRATVQSLAARLHRALMDEADRRQDDAPAVAHDLRGHARDVSSAAVRLLSSMEGRR